MSEPLNLYFIRHGLAEERGTYANDGDRPLTAEGKKKMGQVARRLLELEIQFDLILTSPLVRAKQTAAILLETGLSKQLEESDSLSPGGDINRWLTWLQNWRQAATIPHLALVGHEPDLGEWAETLLWGSTRGVLRLKKAGVIGLTLLDNGSLVGASELFWLSPPRFLV